MNILRKYIAYLLIIQLFLGLTIPMSVVLADAQEGTPLNFDVSIVEDSLEIGYDIFEGYYVGLKWDPPQSWSSDDSATRYYSLWTSEDGTEYVRYPETIPGNQTSIRINKHGNKALEPGKIYSAYIVAEHVHINPETGAEVRHQSFPSNTILFMTKINVEVTTAGSNSINIEWDDVKIGTRRIDYDIYISESNYFGQTTPLPVRQENIGEGKPVRPVVGENRLVYTRTGLRTGTFYYVMIKPIVSDPRVRYLNQTEVKTGATQIIARILRVSSDFWRLEWNAIVSADMDPDKQISYYIRRGDLSQGENPIEETLGQTRDTKMSVRASEELCYYRIVAYVETQTGELLEVRSDRILAVESEIPAVPTVPDLKEKIEGVPEFNYTDRLEPTQATIAWIVPKTPDGKLDSEIVYDIWLVTDPADFDNQNIQPLQANYTVPVSDYIIEAQGSQNVVAFTYTFSGLKANTTYYAKIVAKKMYKIVNPEGLIEDVYYQSEPALRVITTPIDGAVNVPVAPSKPPFGIKKVNGQDDVGTDYITVTWKNEWYEYWDDTDEFNPRWVYVEDIDSVQDSVYGSVYGQYRHILYDSNITFQIGYMKYSFGMDYEQISNIPMNIIGIANNTKKVDQEYTITGLEPNTTYLIWMRAARTTDLVSAPSDPLIAVTAIPEHDPGKEKPVVPSFIYSKVGDIFVDIGWEIKSIYEYNLKYGTSDNINSAGNTVTVTFKDLTADGIYRVEGLNPDTVYYFWVQAVAISSKGERSESDWSDSFSIKTLAFLPPDAPSGFGVKNGVEGIGKNHIVYEWFAEPGMQYILEVSAYSDFSDKKVFDYITGSEQRVEGLSPNTQYYARLYSFDIIRNIKSEEYSGPIRVRTLKSDDEYDSNVNITDILDEELVEQSISRRVWKYTVALSNADRFINDIRTSKDVDYVIKLSDTTRRIDSRIIELPQKAFEVFESVKSNLVIDAGDCILTVKAGTFSSEGEQDAFLRRLGEYSVRFEISEVSSNEIKLGNNFKYKSNIISFDVNAVSLREALPIRRFSRPLLVELFYSDLTASLKDSISGYIYDDLTSHWNKCDTRVLFDNETNDGKVVFEIYTPGKFAVLVESSVDFIDINDSQTQNAIQKIMEEHELRSITGSMFRPSDNITLGEAVRLVLDVCDYKYNGDEMRIAEKAGITRYNKTKNPDAECSFEEVIAMIVRAYEIRNGIRVKSDFPLITYIDVNKVSEDILPLMRFAVEQGIAITKSNWEIAPHSPVSRKDIIIMLSRII